jgi:hypothetical protein
MESDQDIAPSLGPSFGLPLALPFQTSLDIPKGPFENLKRSYEALEGLIRRPFEGKALLRAS